MMLNQVMASSLCLPPSDEVTLISSFGAFVGKKHHRLCPEINAFQAEVPGDSYQLFMHWQNGELPENCSVAVE